jgi:DNA modification methylase
MNQLILGDNLEILKAWNSESVDLIYLDPPFFSNRNYEVIWGDSGEVRSFEDRWSGGVDHYIAWLKERVAEMHRILKPTGSIFLHCDWHANSHIRVYILDKIFGEVNFRNEIIWKRAHAHGDAGQGAKHFGRLTDRILFYVKSDRANFKVQYTPYPEEVLKRDYKYTDPETNRIYRLAPVDGPGGASKGNPYYEFLGVKGWWRFSEEKMKRLYEEGKIVLSKTGKSLSQKVYLDESKGRQADDLWADINRISPTSNERLGYPTQKPEALLERIINCASNEGDVVMDPFVGGGTTVAVADRLARQWVGIDQSVAAIKVTELRLQRQQNLFSAPFTVQLHKYDYDTLRYKDAFEFEAWIVGQAGGIANVKQRGEMGIDGRLRDGTPIQVKRSDDIGRNVIDNFYAAIQRHDKKLFEKNKTDKKPVGVVIAFSFGKGAVKEVARLKNEEDVMIELREVGAIVPIATRPKVTLTAADAGVDAKGMREVRFTAVGTSDAEVEFYAWDFSYDEQEKFKPEVFFDKEGVQTRKFKTGTHAIAVKVVDTEGLDAVEIIRLKVNGGVSRVEG